MSFVNYTVKLDFDEIDEYVFPLDKPFNLEINYDNVKFCFIINLSSKSNNLICFGSGEHARDHKSSDGKIMSPPYYDKELCYEFFDESFIAYADPIFFQDKNITLGWFVGTKSHWYIEKYMK